MRERKDEGSESTRGGAGRRKRGRGKDLEEEEKRDGGRRSERDRVIVGRGVGVGGR